MRNGKAKETMYIEMPLGLLPSYLDLNLLEKSIRISEYMNDHTTNSCILHYGGQSEIV
ncbi:hypothetical protein GBAR_LOCUS24888 [Geodia barretti]|uniref:Uncharacterized protein n=1 Tax=Geodia barretti TaxID=519541 RepID=A0AA35XBQ7_GEOBA|nr:hypothetical protein GBAR_LOCUS24888 [Geodia barretti]